MALSDTFCVLPWIHLATHPNGGSSLCCRSNHSDAISWAKKDGQLVTLDNYTLKEIYNSEKFVEIRQRLMAGEKPIECEGCWLDEAAGIRSKRQYENERWQDYLPVDPKARIEDMQYKYIELRLGSVCNNACVTCNAFSSSKWKALETEISKDLPWFNCSDSVKVTWYNNKEFYDDLLKHSKEVEEIYINGGEPTLIKAHYAYLKDLIAQGLSQKIKLVYSLNMTGIPTDLVHLWKQFKHIEVNASIDDVNERNYYIRYPTSWKAVERSMEILQALPNVTWHVTQTVSIFNVGNLEDLYLFLQEKYAKTPHHNYVMYPEYLSMSALPPNYKDQLITKYVGKLPDEQYNTLVSKLGTEFNRGLLDKARQYIKAVDAARGSSFLVYIPELRKIM